MPTPFWILRTGIYGVTPNNRHFIFSQTWQTFQTPITTPLLVPIYYNPSMAYLKHPFSDTRHDTTFAQAFVQQIYPRPERSFTFINTSHASNPGLGYLNESAPEASFRLQRVGAGVTPPKLGRINLPILDDATFTDLPHRRHVDASYWNSVLLLGTDPSHFTYTAFGHTFTNVIWHRESLSWTAVTGFRVLENTTRCWKRWVLREPPTTAPFFSRWVAPEQGPGPN